MLQKQIITIPLGLGINTKTDEKLVDAGQFNLVSENTTFDKLGASKKRTGYVALSSDFYDPEDAAGTPAGNYATATYKPISASTLGKSVLLRTKIGEYYFKYKDKFVIRNDYPVPEAKVSSTLVYPGVTTVSQCDTVYDSYEGIVACVARDGHPTGDMTSVAGEGSTLVLYDTSKNNTITTLQIPSVVNLVRPSGSVKCNFSRVSGQSYYYNVFVDSLTDMKIWTFNKFGQLHASTYSISGIQNNDSSSNFGAIASCRSTDETSAYFMAPTTAANTAKFVAMSGSTKTFETTFTISGIAFMGAYAFYSSGLIYLYYSTAGSVIRRVILNPNGTVNSADSTYTISGFVSVSGDQDDNTKLFSNMSGLVSYAYNSPPFNITQNKSILQSDKLTIGGTPMVMVADQVDNSRSTYYIIGVIDSAKSDAGSKAVAMMAPETALYGSNSGYFAYFQPSRFAKVDSDNAYIAQPKLISSNGDFLKYGMQLVSVGMAPDYKSFNRATIGPNSHFQGGYVAEFDGERITENGFIGRISSLSLNVSVAGLLTGTYSYVAIQKYIDKNGQITRSSPTLAVATGSISSKKVTVTFGAAPYGLRSKQCSIEVYRTLSTGSVFYYVGEVSADMYGTIPTYTDNAIDSSISDNTILYTEGGVLGNDPAPNCKLVCQGGNRLWVAGLEDENEVAYSKKKLFGESVSFSDFFRIRFDSSQYNITGGITAIGYMDGSFIAFKRNSIFYVRGDGPNELGQNDSFTDPEMISSDTGCTEPRSVVLTPEGLMFKGEKGIYLLGRGLNTSYIGSGVESFNSYNVTSAVLVDSKNQVIFTLVDSNTNNKYKLVYDYFSKQWSSDTGIRAIDGDILDGSHIVLDSSTSIPAQQTPSVYSDNGTVFSSKIKTPWIKVSGVQDFSRMWSISIVGNFKSAHTLRVTAYYDYTTDYSEVYDVLPLISDSQYQYRIHLKKQKCESVQFVIEDINPVGESMILTAISLEVGAKQGTMKLAATRKY